MTLQFSGVVLDLDGLPLDTEKLQFEVGPAVLSTMGYDLAPAFSIHWSVWTGLKVLV